MSASFMVVVYRGERRVNRRAVASVLNGKLG